MNGLYVPAASNITDVIRMQLSAASSPTLVADQDVSAGTAYPATA